MPYIITTKVIEEREPDLLPVIDSVRAVATLAEVVSTLNATGADWTLSGANGEGGGTVGPLPDGSVIEVERVDWRTLADSVDESWPQADRPRVFARLVDAYNAAQA